MPNIRSFTCVRCDWHAKSILGPSAGATAIHFAVECPVCKAWHRVHVPYAEGHPGVLPPDYDLTQLVCPECGHVPAPMVTYESRCPKCDGSVATTGEWPAVPIDKPATGQFASVTRDDE